MVIPSASNIHELTLEQAMEWLRHVSRTEFRTEYVYDLETGPATDDTLRWLIRHPDYQKPDAHGVVKDFHKAITWRGNVGSGKSHLARCLFHMLPTRTSTAKLLARAQTIVEEWVEHGDKVLGRYNTVPILFIDDLGDEDDAKRYGQKREVVGRVIDARAHHGTRNTMLTFFTSNNGRTALRQRYGERTIDRASEQSCVLLMNRESSFRATQPAKPWTWNDPMFNR